MKTKTIPVLVALFAISGLIIPSVSAEMTCPEGFTPDGETCFKPAKACKNGTPGDLLEKGLCVINSLYTPSICPVGTIELSSGKCSGKMQCPGGFFDSGLGWCSMVPPSTCPEGTTKVGVGAAATCSVPMHLECPAGAKVVGLACEGIISCPSGTSYVAGVCYGKNLGSDCPKGGKYYETAGTCWSRAFDSPGAGWTGSWWSWHRASNISCSGGTWNGSSCYAGSPGCSQGTSWNQSTCYAVPRTACPAGTTEKDSVCWADLSLNCPAKSVIGLGFCIERGFCNPGGALIQDIGQAQKLETAIYSCIYEPLLGACEKGVPYKSEVGDGVFCTESKCPEGTTLDVDANLVPICTVDASIPSTELITRSGDLEDTTETVAPTGEAAATIALAIAIIGIVIAVSAYTSFRKRNLA